MKKISVIIPIYNAEEYVEKCIRSVINQTYQNLEIICVDDGSTDKSGQILDALGKTDNRIKVIHQSNKGESAARNVGLRIATGEYIAFVDCDDWIEPNMYEELVEVLEKNKADMAISGWYSDTLTESVEIKNKCRVEKEVFGREDLLNYIYKRDSYRAFAYMWDKLYKRELFFNKEEMILFKEDLVLGGDVLVLAQLALNTKKACYMDKAFYHYIQRNTSGCHTKNLNRLRDWIKAYLYVIEIFEKEHIDNNIVDYVKRFMAYHCSNFAEIAYGKKQKEELLFFQNYMNLYKEEYCSLNMQYEDRIFRYNAILNYSIME